MSSAGPPEYRSAAFLDRDGTLIVDRHYLGDPAGVALLPGAAEAVRTLNGLGLAVVVVTNQSGIGRGLFDEADYVAVHRRMVELLDAEGARLDAVYHCPHAPDAAPPCDCRKPAAGLFLRGAAEMGLDASRSYYVGDRDRDVAPARALGGVGLRIGPPEPGAAPPADDVVRVADVLEAARWIAGRHGRG